MSKYITIAVFFVLSFLGILYVWPETTDFPPPPEGSVQSTEPADTETLLRRSYFTNFTRDEVLAHYKTLFNKFPTIVLNYPPEDAQIYIRDQARSWYLEELVHPFRESLFVNGFIPQKAQDEIWYEGNQYYQKITVRLIPSPRPVRVLVIFSSVFLATVLLGFLVRSTSIFYSTLRKALKP